ncbi:MAG: family 10 glycosylhydrolase [Balneolaceae bacterium]
MTVKLSFMFCAILLISNCQLLKQANSTPESIHPEIQREFRAAWVATVANINWPSSPGLSVEKQQQEAIKLLDLLEKSNFNAVIFQVRPQADALYESSLEPWSYYLTGIQGQAPTPYYDPLDFWIEEAHKRGLELHVWLNPYRAHHTTGGEVSDSSIVNKKSELVVELKNGYWWFDPSLKETQDHGFNVVMDIVTRYDIDGVHFDDYFYPYPSYNDNEDFPDDKSWNAYLVSGGKMTRKDWRRNSVNTFIERVYKSIKKEKSYVKFGLSPFGIWRPGYPESIQGFDQYDELYADAKKWINEGWVDYFSPQLYWPINQIPQSFPVLLGWWNEQNHKKRYIWPGISTGRLQGERQIDEVINNIMITRGMMPKSPGIIHWSIAPLVDSETLRHEIATKPYRSKAIIPPLNWIKHKSPNAPNLDYSFTSKNNISITFKEDEQDVSNWIIYTKYDGKWSVKIIDKKKNSTGIPYTKIEKPISPTYSLFGKILLLEEVQVTYINRLGFESRPLVVPVNN